MITVKIKMMTGASRKEFTKRFKDIESFNRFKDNRLSTNVHYFRYQIKKDGSYTYSLPKTEYSNVKSNVNHKKSQGVNNILQKNSRNNQLALKGNKIINLNMTPARQRSLMKWINSSVPITNSEIKFIKSMFVFNKLSVSQYEAIEDLKAKVNRRVKI